MYEVGHGEGEPHDDDENEAGEDEIGGPAPAPAGEVTERKVPGVDRPGEHASRP